MKLSIASLFFLVSFSAFAGTSGFIYQGKEYIVYENGKKTGKTYSELFDSEDTRKPASLTADTVPLYFTNDGNIRCYRGALLADAGISCVKTN